MTTGDTQKRFSNLTLAVIGAGSLAASLWIGQRFILDLLAASFLAVLCLPVQDRFAKNRFGKHPHLLAFLLTLGVLILIVLPVALLIFLLVGQTVHAVEFVRDQLGGGGVDRLLEGGLPPTLQSAVETLQRVLPISATELKAQALSATKLIAPTLAGIASFSGESLFAVLVMLLGLFFLFLDGQKLARWLLAIVPLEERYSRELFAEFRNVSYAMIFGSTLTALATGVLACLGYWIIGVPNPFVWGTLTGLCQVAPVVGSALIWLPVALILALSGHVGTAIILSVFCVVVLMIGVDNFLRPLIVSRNLTLHPLLIFLGILGGVTTLGLPGLVLGPMIFAFATASLRIYARDFAQLGQVGSGAGIKAGN